MPLEVCEAKMAWLHIRAKTECSTGFSNEEEEGGHFGGDEDEEEEDGLHVLLGPHMAQTLHTLSKKDIIKVKSRGNSSDSEESADMSAFKTHPFKKSEVGDKKKVAGKLGKKKATKIEEKVSSKVSSVESAALDKSMMVKAKKSLEGRMISYPQNLPKANMMDSSLFFILQQQMKQREDEKTAKEQ
eukprot:15335221-Ditylum_brightwellii.AAC.1